MSEVDTAVRIIDAGPSLNFFATNNERLLLSVVGGYLHAPETVQDEVLRRASRDRRFGNVRPTWNKLVAVKRLTVLSDEAEPQLEAAVQRITSQPLAQRKRQAKDLGEIMVIAHAVLRCEAGERVEVLIDDGPGAELASTEIERIDRLRERDAAVGELRIYGTLQVLASAAGSQWLPDRSAMRKVYAQLRACDDGLVHIDQTLLLSPALWSTGETEE